LAVLKYSSILQVDIFIYKNESPYANEKEQITKILLKIILLFIGNTTKLSNRFDYCNSLMFNTCT